MTYFPKLAAPAQRALKNAGITQLEDLGSRTEADLAKVHGMGPGALMRIKAALAEHDLAFKAGK